MSLVRTSGTWKFFSGVVLGVLVCVTAATAQTDRQKQPVPGAASGDTPTQPAAGQAEPRPPNWTMNCRPTDQGLDCRVVQSLFLRNTGKRLLSVVVHVPPDKKPTMLMQLPFGIYLPAGAGFQIGEEEAKNVPFKSCDQFGCLAEYAITEPEIAALSKGQDLKITMVNLRKDPITLTVPALGFADAYAKVK